MDGRSVSTGADIKVDPPDAARYPAIQTMEAIVTARRHLLIREEEEEERKSQ